MMELRPKYFYRNKNGEIIFYVYDITDKYVFWKRDKKEKKMHKTVILPHKKSTGSFLPFKGVRVNLDKLSPIGKEKGQVTAQ